MTAHFVWSAAATDRIHQKPRLFWVTRHGVLMAIMEHCADDAISIAGAAK